MAFSTADPAEGPSGTTSMPSALRNSMKNSNSSGGFTGSTTAVTRTPMICVSQYAAHSHPPRCGRTMTGPTPDASARAMCS